MKDELLFEKRSYIDKSVLTFISLVKFISPNNQMYQVLIGNKDWLLSQINDFSKKKKYWKSTWTPYYKDWNNDSILIKINTKSLEVVSSSNDISSDPVTWKPTTIIF